MAVHDEHGGSEAHEGRPSYVHHHFDTEQQQLDSDKLGMWLFLVTEILLFGGLFCVYATYRAHHPEIFIYAHRYLDKTLGGINTVVLICSSFTMAWAVRAAQLGQRRLLVALLALTLLGGVAFLGIKSVEYEAKWKHGLLWGTHYKPQHEEHAATATPQPAAAPLAAAPAAAAGNASGVAPPAMQGGNWSVEHTQIPQAAPGPAGLARDASSSQPVEPGHFVEEPKNVQIFFGIYFAMTGLHAIHVIIGMVVIGIMLVMALRGRFDHGYYSPVDLTGLYWHLVDLIWIFLFPLLYLIR
jgi:cytochrome c oxidase subunit III